METNYKVGIEVELFLQPNDNMYTSKEDFAKELVSSYRQIKENLMNSGNNQNYGWNFTNLLEGDNYMVKFRRGPGLTAEIDAFRWVEFVVRFINSARNIGTRWGLSQYRRDVLGLHKFLCDYPIPNSNPGLLEPLFADKTGVLEPQRLGQLTPEQARRLRDKDDEAKNKNTIKEKWSLLPM
ncbi:hypothetical protein TEQG_06683 [Trichophyton equinum CBS 127.97]|uniref:Uncharacterized protein n=1 Tax=Trichophyton equinum (strain ATCC MYA-4606 / CBS 127.97) TaxID=559882 RepID=F2Q0N2_TRIEC|nr:hypothetical protein TEQG_06683 [Trichophyton equinum CBS 127.97]